MRLYSKSIGILRNCINYYNWYRVCFLSNCSVVGFYTLRQYVDPFLNKLTEDIVSELGTERHFTLIFDGTSRNGECIVMLYRIVNDDLIPVQRVFCLHTEEKSVNGDQLAYIIGEQLQFHFNIRRANGSCNRLVCAIHDSAAVNKKGIEQLVGDASIVGIVFH